MTQTYLVGGVALLDTPIMIGAGVCKTPARTKDWLKVAPVVSGSYTPNVRMGNEGNRLLYPNTLEEFQRFGFALNSYGMPNMGNRAAAVEFGSYRSEHPLIISIAGFSIEDYVEGYCAWLQCSSVKAIELNVGCPNTEQGKIFSFDPGMINDLLIALRPYARCPIWIKYSPYSDPGLLREVAVITNGEYDIVRAVVTCNTFPNAYAGKDAISPNGGLAGLSGPALKQIALGQVVQFRKHLGPGIDIIGIGGVTTGNDVVDFLKEGAAAVQVNSLATFLGDPGRFWPALLNTETGSRLISHLNL